MTRLLLALAAMAPFAFAQTPAPPDPIQHAAEGVAYIHDNVLDPASFVLDGVFLTKPTKKGEISTCFAFRSRNTMNGYSLLRAVEDSESRIKFFTNPDDSGRFAGYDFGLGAPCREKNIDKEITADVSPLAPPLYKKER